MKSEWEVKSLAQVFDINPSKQTVRKTLVDDDLVSFVPMVDLATNSKDINLSRVKPLKEVIKSYTYFVNGDVLLAKITPCFENGKLGVANKLNNGVGFGSSEYLVFRSKGMVIPEYLYYFLASTRFRKEGTARMYGAAGHKRVSAEFIETYPIQYPVSIEEQKRIVFILDDIFKDADKAVEIYKTNLLKTKNIFESYLNSIFNYESVNWEQSKLGDVAELIRGPFGGSLKKTYFTNSGYAVYEQSHAIHSTYNHFRYFIDGKKYQEMKRFTVNPGDIIMSCSGTMGKTSIIPQDSPIGIINQALLLIRTKKHLLNSFLKLWMESNDFNKKIEKLTSGAAIKNVASVKILKNIDFFYPPLKIQQDIVNKAEILLGESSALEVNCKKNRELIELLKQSVLNKAFGGEL